MNRKEKLVTSIITLAFILLLSSCGIDLDDPRSKNDQVNQTNNLETSCVTPATPAGGEFRPGDFANVCAAEDVSSSDQNWKIVQLKCNNSIQDICAQNFNAIKVSFNSGSQLLIDHNHKSLCHYNKTYRLEFDPATGSINTTQTGEQCTSNSDCSSLCDDKLDQGTETWSCKKNVVTVARENGEGTEQKINEIMLETTQSQFCNGQPAQIVIQRI